MILPCKLHYVDLIMEIKNVIVTGASKGIGKAIARAFAAEGYSLLLTSKTGSHLSAAVQEIKATFSKITVQAKAFDLSQKAEAIAFGNWCLQFCTPDILVNNAGNYLPGDVSTEADGFLEKMIETNLYSAYHVTRTLLPSMKKAKAGQIFNICSIASLHAYPNGGSYSISKFALMGFGKNLREELMPYHIKVVNIYPGAVKTDSWRGFDNSDKRIMEAEDIAQLIVSASKLSLTAVPEDIVIRPQLGDL